jgi:hypothetical protein
VSAVVEETAKILEDIKQKIQRQQKEKEEEELRLQLERETRKDEVEEELERLPAYQASPSPKWKSEETELFNKNQSFLVLNRFKYPEPDEPKDSKDQSRDPKEPEPLLRTSSLSQDSINGYDLLSGSSISPPSVPPNIPQTPTLFRPILESPGPQKATGFPGSLNLNLHVTNSTSYGVSSGPSNPGTDPVNQPSNSDDEFPYKSKFVSYASSFPNYHHYSSVDPSVGMLVKTPVTKPDSSPTSTISSSSSVYNNLRRLSGVPSATTVSLAKSTPSISTDLLNEQSIKVISSTSSVPTAGYPRKTPSPPALHYQQKKSTFQVLQSPINYENKFYLQQHKHPHHSSYLGHYPSSNQNQLRIQQQIQQQAMHRPGHDSLHFPGSYNNFNNRYKSSTATLSCSSLNNFPSIGTATNIGTSPSGVLEGTLTTPPSLHEDPGGLGFPGKNPINYKRYSLNYQTDSQYNYSQLNADSYKTITKILSTPLSLSSSNLDYIHTTLKSYQQSQQSQQGKMLEKGGRSLDDSSSTEKFNKYLQHHDIDLYQQQAQDFMSLSLSPPLSRRNKEMPALRGGFVSL